MTTEEDVEELVRRLQRERLDDEKQQRSTRQQEDDAAADAMADAMAAAAAYDEFVTTDTAAAEAVQPAQAVAEELADAVIDSMERSFSQGDNTEHLARWQHMTDPQPSVLDTTQLADVLTLVVVSYALFTCQFLLRLRISRAMTSAVHDALGHVTAITITDVNVACGRTLATFCTGLRVLDISLSKWGVANHAQFERTVRRLNFDQSSSDRQTQIDLVLPGMLMRSTPWWLAARGGDALLEAFANPLLEEVNASYLTWNIEAGPHGLEPIGFWDDWTGNWKLTHDDPSGSGREPLIRLGLSDAGLYHLSGLRILQLKGCQCITDTGLVGVCRRNPGLRVLDLGECSGIRDETLVAAGQCCPLLELVDLQRCISHREDTTEHGPTVTVEGLGALIHGCCRGLRKLNLAGQKALIGDQKQLFSATPEGATAVGALIDELVARRVLVNFALRRSQAAFFEALEKTCNREPPGMMRSHYLAMIDLPVGDVDVGDGWGTDGEDEWGADEVDAWDEWGEDEWDGEGWADGEE